MANVQGIGGVFIESDDAARLASWYEEVMGIEMDAHPNGTGYYHVFQTRDIDTSVIRQNPVFAVEQAATELAEEGRGFVLNLRVDDLGESLDHLRTHGVEIEERILEWEGGKHAWIRDPDGNRVELYEEILMDQAG